MRKVIKDYGKTLKNKDERDKYKIKLNGVGLHCGKGVVVDININDSTCIYIYNHMKFFKF